jgi:serpin B
MMKHPARLFLILFVIVIPVSAWTASAAPDPAQTETGALVAGNNAFAFDLYHALPPDNLIFSPYSVSLALAMVYSGANGNTAQQMADTLHFTLPKDDLPAVFQALDSSLPREGEPAEDTQEDEQSFRLSIANALWGQEGYPFIADYLALLAEYYGAGMQSVDFATAPDEARQTINAWVSDQTQGRIQDLLQPGTVTGTTRLILANAIYFKAAWSDPFDEDFTEDGPFTLLDGSQVTVPMMHKTSSYLYARGDGFQAVGLPYAGQRMVMLILLPDEGQFETFEAGLDAAQFQAIQEQAAWMEVHLSLPRFEVDADFSLADTLAALGMPDAFEMGVADFSGMTEQEDLAISDVIHKAFIKVDEAGTEAAAATAVAMVGAAAPMEMPEVQVDRPFIYAIYDQDSGTILFLGRVLNPAG